MNMLLPKDPAGPVWPELPLEAWQETCETLHRWTQIVGKIRLALAPGVNHWWQVALYVSAHGFTTAAIPYGARCFQIDFDFVAHELRIETSDGANRSLRLYARSVADFYADLIAQLQSLQIEVAIWPVPVELADRTPFPQDHTHAAYDPEYAWRFWQVNAQVDRVLNVFRGRFIGKASPVQLMFGSLDLCVSCFSGRRAPKHPGAPYVAKSVMVEAYSHEVYTCGFWAGAGLGVPAFYAFAYPEPAGFKDYAVRPSNAYYSTAFREFLLPYDAVRTAAAPDDSLLAFFQSTYEAGANLGQWDRASLERALEGRAGPRRTVR